GCTDVVGRPVLVLVDSRPHQIRVLAVPNAEGGIEQESQSRNASQSSGSVAGETMSPRISILSRIEPIQSPDAASGEGGTTSATGLPNRVTLIGRLVLCTCSIIARHLALNSEMATSFMVH